MPLSKISIGALVWTSDFWAVADPYLTTDTPQLEPLGPSSDYRDPLDFCWTTTMRKDQVNFSPIVIIIAAACIAGVSTLEPFVHYHLLIFTRR